jgi:hypothetical protein
MDGNFRDGESLGKFLDCYSRNETVVKQTFGLIDTQFFQKIESIVNRPFRSSPEACILEIDRCQKGAHMIDLLRILGDDEASRTSAVIRMDNDWKNPDFDKWCIILTRKGAVKDGFRDPSGILIREKALSSPTQRNKQLNKGQHPSTDDEGNIRFFDNIERGRSLSRDRNEPTSGESDKEDARGKYGGGGGERGSLLRKGGAKRETNLAPKIAAASLVGGPTRTLAPFAGISSEAPATNNPTTVRACIFYSKGTCSYGANCKYKQEDGPYLERVTTINESR